MDIKIKIREGLEMISKNFPGIKFSYGFNDYADAHIVRIDPEKDYNSNSSLDNAWMELLDELNYEYPEDHVVFVPPTSSLVVKNPEFCVEHKTKQDTSTPSSFFTYLWDELNLALDNGSISRGCKYLSSLEGNGLFDVFPNDIIFSIPGHSVYLAKNHWRLGFGTENMNKQRITVISSGSNLALIDKTTVSKEYGEYSYAMAA